MNCFKFACFVVALIATLLFLSVEMVAREKLEDRLAIETKALNIQTEKVARLEDMIERDDRLLDQLLHGTWSRECRYQLVPGELLADGSVRSSLIQKCEEQ